MFKSEYDKIRNRYLNIVADKSRDEKIKYLEECQFNIEMIDRWTKENENNYDVLTDLICDLKNEVI